MTATIATTLHSLTGKRLRNTPCIAERGPASS